MGKAVGFAALLVIAGPVLAGMVGADELPLGWLSVDTAHEPGWTATLPAVDFGGELRPPAAARAVPHPLPDRLPAFHAPEPKSVFLVGAALLLAGLGSAWVRRRRNEA